MTVAAKERRVGAEARKGRIVVAHPGRQYVYETVRAAEDAGVLAAFATSVCLDPASPGGRAAISLARRFGRNGLIRSAAGRAALDIDRQKVVTFPYWSAAARLTWPFPFGEAVERHANRRTDASIARWLARLDPKPDAVHGFEGGSRATFTAARERGITTVLDVANAHEYAVRELRLEAGDEGVERLDTARVRAERALADVLVAPSDWVIDCLRENGIDEARIVKVPFGGNPDRISPEPRSGDVFRVLFVGLVGRRKGIRYLLEAWRRLELPDSELVIVGGTDRWGRKLRAEYGDIARFEGQRPAADVDHWLARSDAFVFPSLAEGSAIAVYEAMAAALPVVTTPNAGSVVRDGVDGFIVPPRDIDALCDRIKTLWADREHARRLGRSAQNLIETEFTWAHYRRRLGDLYGRLQ